MHSLFSTYLSNAEFEALCSDTAFIRNMAKVEQALAKAQAKENVIPKEAAEEIIAGIDAIEINSEELAADVLQNGIPTIGFLKQVRSKLSTEAANYLHWGITSQDVTDTALVLVLKEVILKTKNKLTTIVAAFDALNAKHGTEKLSGRTRNQIAVPIALGQKITSWKNPLQRQLKYLEQIESEALNLQLAGADGQLSILEDKAATIKVNMAKELELAVAEAWHSQRDSLTAISDTFSTITAALGKFGKDILFLSQTEVGEVSESTNSGGSSSMPHKKNPVKCEALVALANFAIDLSASLKRAQLHKNERDGVALATEWLVWPKLISTLGAVLAHSVYIAKNLQVHPEKMQQNIDAQNGLLYSEKATYLLTKEMGRTAAKKKIAEASKIAFNEGTHLAEVLIAMLPNTNIDWKSELK